MSPTRAAAADQRRERKLWERRALVLPRIIRKGNKLRLKLLSLRNNPPRNGRRPRVIAPQGRNRPPCFKNSTAVVLRAENLAGGSLCSILTCTNCSNTFVSRMRTQGMVSQAEVDRIVRERPCHILATRLVPIPFEVTQVPCLLEFGDEETIPELLLGASITDVLVVGDPAPIELTFDPGEDEYEDDYPPDDDY